MRPRRLAVLVATALVGIPMMIGCASAPRKSFFFEPNELDPAYWVPKVDRFSVVVDASLTMADRYMGERKLDVATDLARAMNASIPELDYESGFRTFGQFNRDKGSGMVIFTNGDNGSHVRAAILAQIGDL